MHQIVRSPLGGEHKLLKAPIALVLRPNSLSIPVFEARVTVPLVFEARVTVPLVFEATFTVPLVFEATVPVYLMLRPNFLFV